MNKENKPEKTDYYGFTWYAKDFVTSVAVVAMSMSARGAYISLLSYQGIEPSCSLPNNDKVLSRLCGCSIDEWLEVKDEVLARFEIDGDRIFNERLQEERAKIDSRVAQNREAGKRSAEARKKDNSTDVEHTLNTRLTNVQPSRIQEPVPINQKSEEEERKDIAPKRAVSASPEAEETFGVKTSKPKSKVKAKIEVSPEAKTVRKSIRDFLAFKCFHARDTAAQATLVGKQVAQLNVAAEKLQLNGITLPEVEAFWHWFTNGGDFKGTNYAKAEAAGTKTNVAPSVVAELWNAFKASSPADGAAEVPEFKLDFEAVLAGEGIEYGDSDYNTVKENYLTSRPHAAQEVAAYEQARS